MYCYVLFRMVMPESVCSVEHSLHSITRWHHLCREWNLLYRYAVLQVSSVQALMCGQIDDQAQLEAVLLAVREQVADCVGVPAGLAARKVLA
jgi:hypothetical protein